MAWALGHDGHNVVELDAKTLHCVDCDQDIARDVPKGQLTLGAAIELDGKSVDIELGARKDFGS